MDIIGIGYLGFETTKLDEWREYGPQVMGFGIGNTPESDPDSLYFKMDDRRHRLAFHPGTIDRIAYIGKNNEMFFPVIFGCLRTGVVLVPLNWPLAARARTW